MRLPRLAPAFFSSCLAFAPLSASAQQHNHAHAGAAPTPATLGRVHFPVACSPGAQAAFNDGIKLQHSFWYQAAVVAFQQVRQLDPDCTMAYWGEAFSLLTNPYSPPSQANLRQGRALLDEAKRLGARNEREAAYVEALSLVFAGDDLAQHRIRLSAFRDAMERFHNRFPDDSEGAILYALILGVAASPADKTYADQLRGASILEAEWERQPDHPGIVHYLIHLYDYPPLAARGVRAAERYAELAADAPHALHMPSHIFTRIGRWETSIATNQRSARRANAVGDFNEELHALDYMVYAYLQRGEDAEARRAMDGASPSRGDLPVRIPFAFAAAAMPARFALERGAWAEAAALTPRGSNFPETEALTHFARAIGLARSRRSTEAAPDVDALRRIADTLRPHDAYWAEQVDIQRETAEGLLLFAGGRQEEGLLALRAAADHQGRTEKHVVTPGPLAPARELLAEALLEAGQHVAALREFEAVQQTEPRRFRAVAGAARAAELAGNSEAMRRHYAALVEIAPNADATRSELPLARAALR